MSSGEKRCGLPATGRRNGQGLLYQSPGGRITAAYARGAWPLMSLNLSGPALATRRVEAGPKGKVWGAISGPSLWLRRRIPLKAR
jgi:hypothetical protein